ncbi:hypothetical protein L596_028045 [Steinernema carpocapsae]|uniref:Uncharacterized protein n=1 Tax=Steinernema carpocapsae TaxID=34508 RepID=A0A4U5LXA5_STECR|nr:hypothetical protein L596_028045 [Steinernema carpocapsae]
MLRKLEQLEAEVAAREPYIQAALKNGDYLIESGHSAKRQITEKCKTLLNAWVDLSTAMKKLVSPWITVTRRNSTSSTSPKSNRG